MNDKNLENDTGSTAPSNAKRISMNETGSGDATEIEDVPSPITENKPPTPELSFWDKHRNIIDPAMKIATVIIAIGTILGCLAAIGVIFVYFNDMNNEIDKVSENTKGITENTESIENIQRDQSEDIKDLLEITGDIKNLAKGNEEDIDGLIGDLSEANKSLLRIEGSINNQPAKP